MTDREAVIRRVLDLTSADIDAINDAADEAGIDDGDDRDFDTLVADVMNALGF